MYHRRAFLMTALAGAAFLSFARQARADIRDQFVDAIRSGRYCGRELAALKASYHRLATTKPPTSGRAITVDMPSQHLVAYENGEVVLESRVVVGDPGWKTPDLDTSVDYVRFNPTWTVPESIIAARSWREKLARNPVYFQDLNFLVELHGRMVSPEEARDQAASVGRFVQQPGEDNALGKAKIGLFNSNSIYLHDTSDPGGFDEDRRDLSHGCMRVEAILGLCAWVLGISEDEAHSRVSDGDRKEYRALPSPVRLVTSYFTAWPDANGEMIFYPDIYGRDPRNDQC